MKEIESVGLENSYDVRIKEEEGERSLQDDS